MKEKTYTRELTERDIKDLASAQASRKVWRIARYYSLAGAIIVGFSILISSVLGTTFLPIVWTLIVLLLIFYIGIILAQVKFAKQIKKELTNEL